MLIFNNYISIMDPLRHLVFFVPKQLWLLQMFYTAIDWVGTKGETRNKVCKDKQAPEILPPFGLFITLWDIGWVG